MPDEIDVVTTLEVDERPTEVVDLRMAASFVIDDRIEPSPRRLAPCPEFREFTCDLAGLQCAAQTTEFYQLAQRQNGQGAWHLVDLVESAFLAICLERREHADFRAERRRRYPGLGAQLAAEAFEAADRDVTHTFGDRSDDVFGGRAGLCALESLDHGAHQLFHRVGLVQEHGGAAGDHRCGLLHLCRYVRRCGGPSPGVLSHHAYGSCHLARGKKR